MGQIANAMQSYYTFHSGAYPAAVSDLVTSGDLKTQPKKPDGTPYDIVAVSSDGGSCTTEAGNCVQATITVPLSAPQAPNGTWQWTSTTGQVGEYVAPTPTPTLTPTNTPTPTPTPNPINVGLIGYWNIEEGSGTTTVDAIAAQNGTLLGATAWSSDHIPSSTWALNFTGGTTSIGNTAALNPTSISISFWAKATIATTGGASYQRMISKGYPYEVILFQGVGGGFAGNVQFKILNRSVDIANTGAGSFPSNQWNHIIATYDSASGTGKVYINNVLKGTSTIAANTNLTSGGNPLVFAAQGDGGGNFTGLIDKVRIYNKAVDATIVSALYSGGNGQ